MIGDSYARSRKDDIEPDDASNAFILWRKLQGNH